MDIKYKKGQVWNKALTPKMKEFEKETGKNAVYRGKITGGFEYYLWQKEKKKTKKPKITSKPKSKPKPKPKITKTPIKISTKRPISSKVTKQPTKRAKNKKEILNRLVEIQEKYKNDPRKFQKDPEFIKLSQILGRTRRTPIKLQTVKEVKEIKTRKLIFKKSKLKVTIHLPYGKSDNLSLVINFMSPRVKNESKTTINNILEDEWADKYMYNPTSNLRFSQLIFDTDGDIYLKYKIEFVIYDTKRDLEQMFNDLANMIHKDSKFLPTSIRVKPIYTENWIKKYKTIKRKIDALSPYERIIINELEHTDSITKLALIRSLKQKYPKSQFSMITFSRYGANLYKKQYIIHSGVTSGGLGRMKLSKEGKLIQDLLKWS